MDTFVQLYLYCKCYVNFNLTNANKMLCELFSYLIKSTYDGNICNSYVIVGLMHEFEACNDRGPALSP